jgi:leader peptidase (prepilin peptidase)/N-methyltransferase
MQGYLLWVMAAAAGAAIGSFLNVCIYRLPAERSVVRPRSSCPACGAHIPWYDNVPIFSYILLRGRCRRCGNDISVQYPIIEAATALIWLGAAIRFGPTIDALHSAILLTLLLGIAMTDLRDMVIPDQFSIGGLAAGLLLAAVPGGISFLDALIGAVLSYVLLWAVKLGAEKVLGKPALGVGDIHMMAMVGAFLGPGGAFLTILLGSFLGLVIGVPLVWARGRLAPLGSYLPLGTFLALGAAIAHAWGASMLGWYMGSVLGMS